jgi:hypothetical protein
VAKNKDKQTRNLMYKSGADCVLCLLYPHLLRRRSVDGTLPAMLSIPDFKTAAEQLRERPHQSEKRSIRHKRDRDHDLIASYAPTNIRALGKLISFLRRLQHLGMLPVGNIVFHPVYLQQERSGLCVTRRQRVRMKPTLSATKTSLQEQTDLDDRLGCLNGSVDG